MRRAFWLGTEALEAERRCRSGLQVVSVGVGLLILTRHWKSAVPSGRAATCVMVEVLFVLLLAVVGGMSDVEANGVGGMVRVMW